MVDVRQLAHRYDEYLDSFHRVLAPRGECAAVRPFMAWVEGYWRDDAPPEPTAPPAAVSAGAWGIVRWHQAEDALRGYVPGSAGCYELPRDATPPAVGRVVWR